MRLQDITVQVRSLALGAIGEITHDYITDLVLIKRFNNVGSWTLSLPTEYPMAIELAKPGRGLVVYNNSDVLMSGRMLDHRHLEEVDDPQGTWFFTGCDDMIHLADALVFPEPGDADVETQGVAYDIRTGNAETVIRDYYRLNIGPNAQADRRLTFLTLEANGNRGASVTGRGRFDNLGQTMFDLAAVGGLGFDMTQMGTDIQLSFYVPEDKSDDIRMDIDNDMLVKAEYGIGAPTVTRQIVAGQGQGVDRKFKKYTNATSVASEAAWGRKIERFKDRRDTNDDTELAQEGADLLAEGADIQKSLNVVPADETTMEFARDWFLGDIVAVVVDDQELSAIVTEAIIIIGREGVRTAATIGNPVGFDFESKLIAKQESHEERLALLEKNVGAAEVYSESEVDALLNTKANTVHTHAAADVTSGTFAAARIPAATTTAQGAAELATSAETITGTDTVRVVTPAGLAAKVASATAQGMVELATDAEAQAMTDTVRAVTPANLGAHRGLPKAMCVVTAAVAIVANLSSLDVTITWPFTFDNVPVIMGIASGTTRLTWQYTVGSITTTGCTLRCTNWSGASSSASFVTVSAMDM